SPAATIQGVVARTATEIVVSSITVERVRAETAVEAVVAVAAVERVPADVAHQLVASAEPVDDVVAERPVERLAVVRAVDVRHAPLPSRERRQRRVRTSSRHTCLEPRTRPSPPLEKCPQIAPSDSVQLM